MIASSKGAELATLSARTAAHYRGTVNKSKYVDIAISFSWPSQAIPASKMVIIDKMERVWLA